MGIKLSGAKELKAALARQRNVQMLAAPVVKHHGAQLQQNAQRYAPVDTGTLKRSIRLEIRDSELTAEVAATTDYAAYVEYGTRFMLAQPYMRPAFQQQEGKFLRDLRKKINE